MSFVPISDYAPDIDPTTPGVLTDVSDYIPTLKGYAAAFSSTTSGLAALSAAAIGGAICQLLSGSYRVFSGTPAGLFEAATTTWTDVSKGGGYTSTADDRWVFAQFGDTTLAANQTDTLQYSTATGAFADVSGAPKATVVETVPGFVMLGGTNEGTYGDQRDRWWCSAFNDFTDWTPAVSTQCTTGRLISAPGPITAVKRFGNDVVYYKERAMFYGRYVGAPDGFDFTLIDSNAGTPAPDSVINIGNYHVFVGYDDFYLYDGTRPVPIGDKHKETFFNDLNKVYRYKITGAFDRQNDLCIWFYPSGASTTCDKAITYNIKNGKWGKLGRGAEAAIEYLTGQVTYANISNFFASYTAIDLPYDSPFWSQSSPVFAYFNSSHVLQLFTGTPGSCYFTTGDMGVDDNFSMLSRVRPRFSTAPSSATMTNYYKNTSGATATTDQTVSMVSGKFDVLRSSRWHSVKVTTVGACETSGLDIQAIPEGQE